MQIFATQNITSSTFFSLKNMAFRLYLLLLLTAPVTNYLQAEPIKRSFDKFQISIPDQFESSSRKPALIYLSHKNQQYPTFNIIKEAGPWSYAKLTAADKKDKIEHEYKSVGIKSAKALSIRSDRIADFPVDIIDLSFNSDNKSLRSKLWVLSLIDRHYLITGLYEEALEEDQLNQINHLVESITIDQSIKPLSSKHTEFKPSSTSSKKYSLLFITLIFIGYWYFRKPKSRPKD